jgi:16S rRNA G527 N7-methylase RsmG
MITFEYGAMSSKYSCQAENKLTAYATMCYHFNRSAHLIALYAPEEIIEDSWLTFSGQISERLDEIFADAGGFDKYVEEHIPEIKKCYNSIKKLI